MKIVGDAIIPKEKLTQYLLLPRQKNDKSQWLAQAGFTREQPGTLEKAIYQLITENEAIPDRQNEYGTLRFRTVRIRFCSVACRRRARKYSMQPSKSLSVISLYGVVM